MKRRLVNLSLAAALVLTSMLAGAVTTRIIPNAGWLTGLGLPHPASASTLTVESKGPVTPLAPAGTGFTYQGSLKSGGNPASGSYDFVFTLFDAASAGSQVSSPITLTNQTVTNGLFTVTLDFGSSAFDGNARYLELAVRTAGVGSYTTLSPRQAITPAPYALFAQKTTPYKNVVTVAQSGGQFTSIQAALSSITDNSSTNRYLVRIGPGTYTETVTMKDWVDIEGSGEKSTKITFTGSSFTDTGTVIGANNAELRSLTVENTGGNSTAIAIINIGTSPSLLHVTARASGATSNCFAVDSSNATSLSMSYVTALASSAATYNYGVYNYTSSPTMSNVIAGASGAGQLNEGVYNYYSSPSMSNVTVSASGGSINVGAYNEGSTTRMLGSTVSADTGSQNYGVYSFNGGPVTIDDTTITVPLTGTTVYNSPSTTTRVGASRLVGGPVTNAGTLSCSASFDGNNKRLGANCTRNSKVAVVGLTDGDYVSITAALNDVAAWCGTPSTTNKCLVHVDPGTYTEQVTMVQYVDIEGSGEDATKITFTGSAGNTTGTVNGVSNAEMRSLTVENTGGNAYAAAIVNFGAAPSLLHVTAVASGGTTANYGVLNSTGSPNMAFVTASVSGVGSSYNYAVQNGYSSSANMSHVTTTASGGYANYGVFSDSSSARIVDSNIGASGNATGLETYSGGPVTVDDSKIAGDVHSIIVVSGTTRVGASQLSGGSALSTGTLVCAASYDGNNKRLGAQCTPETNTVYVAVTGGDYTSVQAALNDVATWCGTPSATNKCLVRVGPGTYNEQVTMLPYVDIAGAGENVTKITSAGTSIGTTGTLMGASNAELRFLTVESIGNGRPIAIYNRASPSLLHVTALASGGSEWNIGVYNVGTCFSSMITPGMLNVTVMASGAGNSYNNKGIYNECASPRIASSVISATGGTSAVGVSSVATFPTPSALTIENSTITVPITGTTINGGQVGGVIARVSASQLVGGPVSNLPASSCAASYDGNNRRLGTDCTRNTKVALVGLTDGDYTSVTAALNDVTTWCGTPLSTNKCLVRVAPGTYTERVTMRSFVDIEGSGEQNTKITFTGSNGANTGTVVGANNAELRSLTVENSGGSGNTHAIAIYNSSASPSLLHVTALAFGGSLANYALFNSSSSPTLSNVTATAVGSTGGEAIGFYLLQGSSRIVGSNITASSATNNYGVFSNTGGSLTIDSSKITGGTLTIYNLAGTVRVGASQLSGGAVGGGGQTNCIASYNTNYANPGGFTACP